MALEFRFYPCSCCLPHGWQYDGWVKVDHDKAVKTLMKGGSVRHDRGAHKPVAVMRVVKERDEPAAT